MKSHLYDLNSKKGDCVLSVIELSFTELRLFAVVLFRYLCTGTIEGEERSSGRNGNDAAILVFLSSILR